MRLRKKSEQNILLGHCGLDYAKFELIYAMIIGIIENTYIQEKNSRSDVKLEGIIGDSRWSCPLCTHTRHG